jgi:hypothetical protein
VAIATLAPLLIALLAWHAVDLLPQPGLDASWAAGLHMAAHSGPSFGDHLVFTYGPLGFLTINRIFYSDTALLAFVYLIALRVLAAGALFAAARRSYGTAGGLLVALVVASTDDQILETVSFFIAAVLLVDRSPDQWSATRRRIVVPLVAGAFAGAQLLLKESIGIELTAMAAVLMLALPGRRREQLGLGAAGWIVGLLAGWTVSGQAWGALPEFAHNAARIVSGYAGAMGLEDPSLGWQGAAGWVAVALGVGAALQQPSYEPRRRWGVVGLWLVLCFFSYKEGFVRHDIGHAAIFVEALAGGYLAFRWRRGLRWVGVLTTGALVALALAAQLHPFSQDFDPVGNTRLAVDQMRQVFSGSERRATMEQGRALVAQAYAVDPATVALLRGHTVHVAPIDAAEAWALRLHWQPLPVFQSYTAYTSGLDRVNADAVNSSRAPQRILDAAGGAIDGRYAPFDDPLTTRAILCRYAELRTTAAWDVLGLGPQRCGAPALVGRASVPWGRTVPIPAPANDHSFVFVRIGGVAPAGLERIRALLYKPAQRYVYVDGGPSRLVAGTAGDGLVLRAPTGVDFTRPFNVSPQAHTISVTREGGNPSGDVTYAFYSQSVSVGPRTPGLVPGVGPSQPPPTASASPLSTQAFLDDAQSTVAAYCAHPQTPAPPAIAQVVRRILVVYRHGPAAIVPAGHFAGQSVRQVVAEFGGLLNAGCSPPLGAQVGRALRGR